MKSESTVQFSLAIGVAALLSVGAGIYLLAHDAYDRNWDALLHGVGAFFIACGVFMGWHGLRKAEELELLRRIADATPRPPSEEGTPE